MAISRLYAFAALVTTAVLPAAPAHATLFTVGPGGTHAGLQAAVTAAAADSGTTHEIRVQATEFTDQPFIQFNVAKTLTISGGWDAAFATRTDDPASTRFTVPAGVDARALSLNVSAGRVTMSNFTLHGGRGVAGGAGAEIRVSGSGNLTVSDCVVRDNSVSTEFSGSGGGIDANLLDDGAFRLAGCRIHGNSLTGGGGSSGSGLYLGASGTSFFLIEDNRIEDNVLGAYPGQTTAQLQSAVSLAVYASADGQFVGNVVAGNHIESASEGPTPVYGLSIAAGGLSPTADGHVRARGNVIRDNGTDAPLAYGAQVELSTANLGGIEFGDSQISGGRGGDTGLRVFAFSPTAAVLMTHLTIADNDGAAIRTNSGGPGTAIGTLHNSIMYGNSVADVPLPAWFQTGNNLIGVDPYFVAAASGNFRLAADSPAIDAGDDSIPAGIGSLDADGGPRVIGASSDIGAYEYRDTRLFSDGFE